VPTSKNKKIEGLTIRQRNAAFMIASGSKLKEVAKKLKVTPETLRLWGKKEEFQTLLNKTYKSIELNGINQIRVLIRKTTDTLSDLLGPDSPSEIRLKTASYILGINEIEDLVRGERNGNL
jgi:hypothetical protein